MNTQTKTHASKNHIAAILAPTLIVALPTALIAGVNDQLLTTVLLGALVNLVLTIGTYIFVGNSGVVSFGQMAFMMTGAYASALVSIPTALKPVLLPDLPSWLQATQLPLFPSILVGGVVAAVAALVTGFPLMRLSGIQAGIASLALLLIAQNVASHWDSVTKGTSTMIGIPADLSLGAALVVTVVVILIAYAYQRSRFGLRLRSTREDELAAIASGVRVARERHIAFVLSAFVCGMGGAMFAHYLGALSSTMNAFFTPTFLTIAMLVIGGLYSLSGAVVGTLAVSLLVEVLRRVQDGITLGGGTAMVGLDTAAVGIVLLITLIVRPSGLTKGREARWPARKVRDHPTKPPQQLRPAPSEPSDTNERATVK